jgi:hypothetical protein
MRKLLFAVALLGIVSVPTAVNAQTTVGPFLAFHDDFDFGVGAYVTFPVEEIHENLAFSGSFGYFFPDDGGGAVDVTYWELNADAILRIPTESAVRPFLLGGINIARVDVDVTGLGGGSNTEAGLNLGGGVAFPGESFTPMVGAKLQIDGGDGFMIFGGLGFPVGGGGQN